MTDELPRYIGHLTQIERAEWDDSAEYILYGIQEEEDILADDVDRVEVSGWDGQTVWHDDLRPYFLDSVGDNVVLTDDEPDGVEYEFDVERQDVRVAIEEYGKREYIEIDDTWYGPHYSAGELYIEWRYYGKGDYKGEHGDEPDRSTPPHDADVYEVSLLEPFSGGGTFYAECDDRTGSGDMPEEAMSDVLPRVGDGR